MTTKILAFLAISVAALHAQAKITYRCDCFQLIPFESFGIFVVATENGEEEWMELTKNQYTTMNECLAAAKLEKVCKNLP